MPTGTATFNRVDGWGAAVPTGEQIDDINARNLAVQIRYRFELQTQRGPQLTFWGLITRPLVYR
jgi:hypothetical protein